MRRHDVLVLPSLFEGFALVIFEAMSQGLPVIITPTTGGGDIVTDSKEGFIVPIRSSGAITQKLELLITDSNLLTDMSMAAQSKAAEYSWKRYRHNLVKSVKNMLK